MNDKQEGNDKQQGEAMIRSCIGRFVVVSKQDVVGTQSTSGRCVLVIPSNKWISFDQVLRFFGVTPSQTLVHSLRKPSLYMRIVLANEQRTGPDRFTVLALTPSRTVRVIDKVEERKEL